MDQSEILEHCVIVEVTSCEKESYWYSDLVGKQLVAFGFDNVEEEFYCCHKDNAYNEVATLPIEDCKIIKGRLNDLYDMGL